ncbi:SdpI family protein [Candidatus Woesearchaeota archaeon]|nr:SdpI family protein [Candidatus Woesearchaeota archaeon]
MKKSIYISLILIVLSFITSIYFYPRLPDKIASHWNAIGEVDGYSSKFWGLFLLPLISAAVFVLFIFIPKIDPLQKNISKFRQYFDSMILLIILFFIYVYLLMLFWNLNFRFNMMQMLVPAFGVLFFYMGIIVEKAKRNYFVGIRTPWTLANDKVWDKTHKLGGKLFKTSGVIALIGVFFENYAFLLMIIPVIVASVFLIGYSYWVFRKEK